MAKQQENRKQPSESQELSAPPTQKAKPARRSEEAHMDASTYYLKYKFASNFMATVWRGPIPIST